MLRKFLILVALMLFVSIPATAFGESLEFSWEYAPDMDNVVGFRLYASTTSGQYAEGDVIADVSYQTGVGQYTAERALSGTPGQETTYYFVATAYNEDQESDYSNEVSYSVLGSPESLTFTVVVPVE